MTPQPHRDTHRKQRNIPLKTIVVNKSEKTRLPFLRGILIRRLLESGLPFEAAYELATTVRDSLAETDEITSERLRQKVSRLLQEGGHSAVDKLFRLPLVVAAKVLVIGQDGSSSAFSRGKHQRYLQSSGVRVEDAERISERIFDQLLSSSATRILSTRLAYLTYLCLKQELGEAAGQQYLVWMEFQHSGRPLILLICGAVGSGKSSISTEIAHRLEIVRTQSTDMLREVMRTMITKKLLPILHCSSFDAWKAMPLQERKHRDKDLLIAEGYRTQADLLAVPCEAVMRRAIKESVPLILEGVHSHPDLLHRLPADSDAIMVHVTLAVMHGPELQARLRGRGMEVPQRRAKRYLFKFDSIWRLQTFLLSEAERCDTPIIPNDDKETAIFQVISTVNAELALHFSGDPARVFGAGFTSIRRKTGSKSWQQAVPLLISGKNQPLKAPSSRAKSPARA